MRLIATVAAAVLAAGILVSAPALADPPSGTAAAAERVDLQQVQQSLAPLAKAFGVDVPAAANPSNDKGGKASNTQQGDSHKTMGDAADRAIDMLQNITMRVSDTLTKMAPKLFEIMVRQQYAKAYSGPIVSATWILATLLFMGVTGKLWKKAGGDWFSKKPNEVFTEPGANDFWRFILTRGLPLVVIAFAMINLGYAVQDSVLHLVNPEYYAIQDIIRSIMRGGAL